MSQRVSAVQLAHSCCRIDDCYLWLMIASNSKQDWAIAGRVKRSTTKEIRCQHKNEFLRGSFDLHERRPKLLGAGKSLAIPLDPLPIASRGIGH